MTALEGVNKRDGNPEAGGLLPQHLVVVGSTSTTATSWSPRERSRVKGRLIALAGTILALFCVAGANWKG